MNEDGTMFIDTPGMRALGMWDAADGLGQAFPDVEEFFGRCRFRDCRHQSEPGCAVKAALESGALLPERWNSYCKLRKEEKHMEKKTAVELLKRNRSAKRSRERSVDD